MPPVSIAVFHRRTVACTAQESARFIGIWIVLCQTEWAKRGITLVTTVTVNVVFRSRAGILEVIGSVMLRHPCALDERSLAEHNFGKPDLLLRQFIDRFSLCFQKFFKFFYSFLFAERHFGMVFSHTLISDSFRISVNQLDPLGLRHHCLFVELDAPDRRHVVAAPVKIEFSIIIEKQVRIPEIESSRDALERAVQDIFCAVKITDRAAAGCAEIDVIADHAHIRRIVIQRQAVRQTVALPVNHILRNPDAQRHGCKNIIFSLK